MKLNPIDFDFGRAASASDRSDHRNATLPPIPFLYEGLPAADRPAFRIYNRDLQECADGDPTTPRTTTSNVFVPFTSTRTPMPIGRSHVPAIKQFILPPFFLFNFFFFFFFFFFFSLLFF